MPRLPETTKSQPFETPNSVLSHICHPHSSHRSVIFLKLPDAGRFASGCGATIRTTLLRSRRVTSPAKAGVIEPEQIANRVLTSAISDVRMRARRSSCSARWVADLIESRLTDKGAICVSFPGQGIPHPGQAPLRLDEPRAASRPCWPSSTVAGSRRVGQTIREGHRGATARDPCLLLRPQPR